MPQYPGCEDIVDPSARYNCSMKAMVEYLSEHIVYPAEAKASKLEGTVIVSFVVTKEGAISKAMVAKGFDEACDAEALRVVNEMPNWVAGEHEGKVVNVQMNLPIRFRL